MRAQVKLPKLGDTANEVVVISWHAEVGAKVAEGDPLLTVQTDKVDVEVPCPLAGVMVEHLVAPDDEVAVGSPIAIVEF
jgi:pyruvate dehydrogenase E2 component (dihydrolipoamide acetyltransferase)